MINNLEYKIIGHKKPAIVLLHGWGMSGKSFEEIVQNVSSDQMIIIPDFFGFGKSNNPPEYFDTYEYAYYIFLLLSKLNIDEVILVGHSFGGRVSIILSSKFNLKVKNLILTSSAGLLRFDLIKSLKIAKFKLIKKLVNCKILKPDILFKYGSSDYKNSNSLKVNFVKIINQDLSYLIKCICVKTYLVWDKKDKVTPYWICKKLNKNIKSSEIVLYKTGGHFCYLKNIYKFSSLINNCINN